MVVIEESLTGKRGLDIAKVEMVMSREQERDLTFLFRIDQLKLFDPTAKAYHRKAKPSDLAAIQLLFEARDLYVDAKANGDSKQCQLLLKQMDEIIARAEVRRDKALERMFAWKKQAEETVGKAELSIDDLTSLAGEP